MKSYCIKTDNERIIEYLLNKISKLEFPNIYYCKKSFKIYENVVMHYKDEYIDKFNNIVTTLIVDTIRTFFEERILKRIINVNYFYFDESERNIIYDDCNEFLKQDDVEINETIFKSCSREEAPTIILKLPGSTSYFFPDVKKANLSGVIKKLTRCFSPGFKVIR